MQPPHKLNPETPLADNLALINDNNDKIVQNITDLGVQNSNTITVTFAGVTAGSAFNQIVYLVGSKQTVTGTNVVTTSQNITGNTAMIPAIDLYVDTDNNSAFLWPYGASLTGGINTIISVPPTLTYPSGVAGAIVISGRNKDVGSHTYYVHLRIAYFPLPTTSVFR